MKNKKGLIGIVIVIIMLIIIIVVGLFVIVKMDFAIDSYYQIECIRLNNQSDTQSILIFYDHDSNETRAGVYCLLQNGSKQDITIRSSQV